MTKVRLTVVSEYFILYYDNVVVNEMGNISHDVNQMYVDVGVERRFVGTPVCIVSA